MTDTLVFPQLRFTTDLASPLPLEHTAIEAHVIGLVASVSVRQRFRNPLTEKADLEYLFPLPHESAVTAFELHSGERVVRASVQELEQARQQFESARQQGKHAGLLESRRPNLFALQLANIQPGEFIETLITYHQHISLTAGQVEFVFPMGLTPKYHRSNHPEEAQGVDAPLTLDLSQVGDVVINVDAEAGLSTPDPHSPSHPIIVTRHSATRFNVCLDGPHLPNKDFVLRWQIPGDAIQFPAWHVSGETGIFMATFLPPVPDFAATPIPCEYIFVLDRSGSMSGAPIRQAINALRACLRSLNPQDTFAILLFDNRLEWLTAVETVTQASVEMADQSLDAVDGRGGTEILPALQSALSLPQDPERTRLVVFLTDGAVSAEAQVLDQVRKQVGAARLFTFGVGPSVNRAFLHQLAHLGRGQAQFIGLDEDIEDVILRFQDRISFPLLTNLSLRAENGQVWDVYPSQLPDLYAGCPLEVVGRYRGEGDLPVTLIAVGERLGTPLEMRVMLKELSPDSALLSRVWARARVDDLSERTALGIKAEHETRAEIISLALAHSLLTKYTAFVAIDSNTPATPGQSQFIRVAHPLPEGLSMDGFINAPASPMLRSASAPQPSPSTHQANFQVFRRIASARPLSESPASQKAKDAPIAASNPELVLPPSALVPAATLHELARTQRLDGSWNNDVEYTAAALLAFVRNGHTTLIGHFRKQITRAFAWLSQTSVSGFPVFLRALAFRELADATQAPEHLAAVEKSISALPAPGNSLEVAIQIILHGVKLPQSDQKSVQTMDQLRMAAITNTKDVAIAPELLAESLGRVLAVGLK